MPKSKLRVRALVSSMAVAMLLTACQDEENAAQPDAVTSEAAADATAPQAASAADATGAADVRIDPAIASGVAFTYSADYRLPDAAVGEAQSRHVAACAALGRVHCRVGDIRFDQRSGGQIRGSLILFVDPALARGFLRDAERMVTALDGEILASSITGEDVGTDIANSQANSARLGGDLTRLERRLAAPGLGARERENLQEQVARLRGQLRDGEEDRAAGEARLATTPIELRYTGQTGIAGINPDRPFASAFAASAESFGTFFAWLLTLLGVVAPWAMVAALGVLIWRVARRKTPAVPSK
ncbi:MAG: DUF4349 domain-containing protein [Sphingomonadaceae bacterium]|nr:DUF4349 domain-containing protein [Sphingomonadaceae bacterium]